MMRKPDRRRLSFEAPRSRDALDRSISAPVAGLNQRDPLAEMKSKDAVILDNWFCTPYDVRIRDGYTIQASGITGTVSTLMSYAGSSGQLKLFAAAGTNIYDVTTPGAVGAPDISGLGSDQWQHVNYGIDSGTYLVAVNGTDFMRIYNGSAWQTVGNGTGQTISSITSVGTLATLTTAAAHGLVTGNTVIVSGATPANYNGTFSITVTGANTFTYVMAGSPGAPASPVGTYTYAPAITGVLTSALINVTSHQSRLWFVEKNTMNVWYLPASSIGGAASKFNFAPIFKKGGYLVSMGIISIDGGSGMDDYAVFVTSQGEIAIYRGTDPASASTWAKVGVYQAGKPIGLRCFTQYGGDLIYINRTGISPIVKSIMSAQINNTSNISDRIQSGLAADALSYYSVFGWDLTIYPSKNALLLNVPTPGAIHQWVMNTITGAWSRFYGWNATDFELHDGALYFGGNGYVALAWNGFSDNGVNIETAALPAFNRLGNGHSKHVTLARPILAVSGTVGILMQLNVNYDMTPPVGAPSYSSSTQAVWDSAVWDAAVWGSGEPEPLIEWNTVSGDGTSISLYIKTASSNAQVRWSSTDYLYEIGSILGG